MISSKLENIDVKENQIAIVWMTQAGFLMKTSNNKIIAIDLYLSHCGERMKNFIRLSPILAQPKDLDIDYYLITHKHFDHFDYDAIPVIAKNKKTKFLCASSCVEELKKIDVEDDRIIDMKDSRECTLDGITFKATYADHGVLEPSAIGFKILVDDIYVYITGDTSYREEEMIEVKNSNPEIMVACINGEFGNLGHEEAAKLSQYVKADCIIPCHFWTFMQHKSSPWNLDRCLEEYSPQTKPQYMTPGDIYIYEKQENDSYKMDRVVY